MAQFIAAITDRVAEYSHTVAQLHNCASALMFKKISDYELLVHVWVHFCYDLYMNRNNSVLERLATG